MADAFNFELVSPERLLLSEEVTQVGVPGADGYLTVMSNHAPMMTTLAPGIVETTGADGQSEQIFVRGGFADVTAGGLTVLAEVAVPVAELTGDRLAAEKSHAEGILAANDVSPEEVLAASRAAEALASV